MTKGGLPLDTVLDMSEPDFMEWHEAAATLEERIAEAMKG